MVIDRKLHSSLSKASSNLFKILAIIFLAFALVGCARTQMDCSCFPLPARSLESLGSFDSNTNAKDIKERVGKLGIDLNPSGIHGLSYILDDRSLLVIQTSGAFEIYWVKHGMVVLYDRYGLCSHL